MKTRLQSGLTGICVVFALVVAMTGGVVAQTVIDRGDILTLTGPGELDLTGDISYAVNFGGTGPIDVRGVTFVPDAPAPEGAVFVGGNTIGQWVTRPDYGELADDENLETIMHSIRYDSTLRATLEVVKGARYKLQVLFAGNQDEYRIWDIQVDGKDAVDEISSLGLVDADGLNPFYDFGVSFLVYTYEFVPLGDTFEVRMGNLYGYTYELDWWDNPADRTPIWQALTLEQIGAPVDTDGDGMPDPWEQEYGLNPNVPDGQQDLDGDGLVNVEEFDRGTDPKDADSDDDTLSDKVESGTGIWVDANDRGTNPRNPDTDGDGLSDAVETNTRTWVSDQDTGTSPLLTDTDGDGFSEPVEIRFGTDPSDPYDAPILGRGVNLLAYWNFDNAGNPDLTLDSINGFEGTLEDGAAFTAGGVGHTGLGNDRAMDFGTTSEQQRVVVHDAEFLNVAAVPNRLTVSVWAKLAAVADSSAFWGYSPSSSGGGRGIQAHIPWSNNNIYFDSAGCCDGATQRISAPITNFAEYTDAQFFMSWHHFAFVKDGNTKQIWIDGILFHQGTNTGVLPKDFTDMFLGSEPTAANSMQGMIDDLAVFAAPLSESYIISLSAGVLPTELEADADSDGMPDLWEDDYGTDKNVADADGDPDGDGLTNLNEYKRYTDPLNPDTDADGLVDGVESGTGVFVSEANTGTDPTDSDTDDDGLLDGVETGTGVYVSMDDTGTDPHVADTDSDLYPDMVELMLGSSPFSAGGVPVQAGSTNLLCYWDFNDASDPARTLDVIHGFEGVLQNGTVFTPDGNGYSGAAGDRGVDLGTTSANQTVRDVGAYYLGAVAPQNQITVTLWMKLWNVAGTTAFWLVSPGSSGEQRGMQAHIPWSDNNIYFDTAGCCYADVHRVNGNVTTFEDYVDGFFQSWHHFALIKDGDTKQVWIDGKLFLEGTNTGDLPGDMNELVLGAYPNGGSSLQGVIDEFAVFASALTGEQIGLLAGGATADTLRDNEPPTISMSSGPGGVGFVLEWTGTLQESPTATGPWTDVPGAPSSPLTVTATEDARFYRATE